MKHEFVSNNTVSFLVAMLINFQPQILHATELARFAAFNSEVSHLTYVSTSSYDAIEALAYSPDGRLLVSSHSDSWITIARHDGYNGGINIWDARTLEHVGALPGHEFGVFGLSFTPDGEKLVSASEDNTIRVWKFISKSEIVKIEDVIRFYYDVAVLPSGSVFLAAGSDKIEGKLVWNTLRNLVSKSNYYLQQRDIETGNVLKKYVGHADTVNSIELSPDGKTFATSSLDGSVRIWDIESGNQEKIVFEHEDGHGLIYGLSYTTDGKSLAYGLNGELYITDVANLGVVKTFNSPSVGVEFILNDAYLLAYNPGRFVIWDVKQEKAVLDLGRVEMGGRIGAHAVSPDGSILALGFDGDNDSGQRLILINLVN